MKKLLIAGMVLSLILMFAVVAGAEVNNGNNDVNDEVRPGYEDPVWEIGKGIFADHDAFKNLFTSSQAVGADYKTVVGARVTARLSDIIYDPGDQEGSVKITSLANIPCYIELELIGNAGWTKIKSMGTGASGIVDRTNENHWMLFDSAFGGFVNEDWESIGQGVFSQIGPAVEGRDTVYLTACDMWTANLYANMNYGFDVTASPLVNGNEDSILMDMRHTMEGIGWTEALQIGNVNVGTWNALESATVYMQFRVPFQEVPGGAYEGDVTFKIYSI